MRPASDYSLRGTLCSETNRCRVSKRCHHLDVCWSQLVNYRLKKKKDIKEIQPLDSKITHEYQHNIPAILSHIQHCLCFSLHVMQISTINVSCLGRGLWRLTWNGYSFRRCKVLAEEITSPVLKEQGDEYQTWIIRTKSVYVTWHRVLLILYHSDNLWDRNLTVIGAEVGAGPA